MANYTTNYKLYKPSRNDDLEIDTSLADVMDKIDTTIKGVEDLVGKDDTIGASKRIKAVEDEINDGRKTSDGNTFTKIGDHIRWVYANAKGSGGGGTASGVPRFIKKDTSGQAWEITIGTDGAITTLKVTDDPTILAQYQSTTVTPVQGATTFSYTLGFTAPNTNYRVSVIPNWGTNIWVTNKTTTSFTINFSAAPLNSAVDVVVFLQ